MPVKQIWYVKMPSGEIQGPFLEERMRRYQAEGRFEEGMLVSKDQVHWAQASECGFGPVPTLAGALEREDLDLPARTALPEPKSSPAPHPTPSLEIVYLDGPQERRVPIADGDSLLVGRGPYCDIVLEEPKASRQHCKIWCESDAIWVRDMDSSTGTRLAGRDVTHATTWATGEALEVGRSKIDLVLIGSRVTRSESLAPAVEEQAIGLAANNARLDGAMETGAVESGEVSPVMAVVQKGSVWFLEKVAVRVAAFLLALATIFISEPSLCSRPAGPATTAGSSSGPAATPSVPSTTVPGIGAIRIAKGLELRSKTSATGAMHTRLRRDNALVLQQAGYNEMSAESLKTYARVIFYEPYENDLDLDPTSPVPLSRSDREQMDKVLRKALPSSAKIVHGLRQVRVGRYYYFSATFTRPGLKRMVRVVDYQLFRGKRSVHIHVEYDVAHEARWRSVIKETIASLVLD